MPNPDYQNIVNAAINKQSSRIPLYEHIISTEIMETLQGKQFTDLSNGDFKDKVEYFRHYCDFFRSCGYDTVSYECCVGPIMPDSGALGGNKEGAIKTRSDFDLYPWDSIAELFFKAYRDNFMALGEAMPLGMKAIGGVGNGIFECVQDVVGFMELCIIKYDDESLYNDLFARIADILVQIWVRFLREFGSLFCVCRFGDDLGFKTSTLLATDDIINLIVPGYKRIIDVVHSSGKPFLLHSCGSIFSVMDAIIDAGIDAKHSNEDIIAPFSRWINDYGDKIGNFGGLDTDVLCHLSSVDIMSYTTEIYRHCEAKGRGVAIGSGNSIPDYICPDRYSLMLETVHKLRGDS